MDQQEVRASVEKILNESHVGTMATVHNNKPNSRYMTFLNEDFTLYAATSKETGQAKELAANPQTHILLGYDGEGFGDDYVEYEGKVKIKDSAEWKKKVWNEYMENWFDGIDDPNLIVLEIEPIEIKLMNKKSLTPNILDIH